MIVALKFEGEVWRLRRERTHDRLAYLPPQRLSAERALTLVDGDPVVAVARTASLLTAARPHHQPVTVDLGAGADGTPVAHHGLVFVAHPSTGEILAVDAH